jgi:hypothetical protein
MWGIAAQLESGNKWIKLFPIPHQMPWNDKCRRLRHLKRGGRRIHGPDLGPLHPIMERFVFLHNRLRAKFETSWTMDFVNI